MFLFFILQFLGDLLYLVHVFKLFLKSYINYILNIWTKTHYSKESIVIDYNNNFIRLRYHL